MPSPSPIGPVVRPAVINDWRRTVVDRPFHDFGSFDHSRSLPVHRGGAGTRLRHTAAQVERRLNRKTLLVLPGDFTPTAIAPPCIDEAAAWNFCDDLASRPGRGPQIDGGGNISRLCQSRRNV